MFQLIKKPKIIRGLLCSLLFMPLLAFGVDTLNIGGSIQSGQAIKSKEGNYELMLETNGNLVVYKLSSGQKTALWSSNTFASHATDLVLQSDGNLVLYNGSQKAVWASGTMATIGSTGGSMAIMQNDGNFVVYDANYRPRWATGTWAR